MVSLLPFVLALGLGAEDLHCLEPIGEVPPSRLFVNDLTNQARAALVRRAEVFEALKTPAQIQEHQARLRQFFVDALGGFPEKTPLEPQLVGRLFGPGYRVEKVIFSSRPNHHVTAALFLPEGNGPFPGVLVASGHSRTAKSADYNQRFGIALARNGMAALCYDPIGQGERSQLLTAEGAPKFPGTTTEHIAVGHGSILVGRNTASYRVWDAIRAIDYLCGRDDIDPAKIGFTGCSGGGTMTSYLLALDDRVACAAPACYITTFGHLLRTLGPQDAEQNIHGQLAFGMDQPDFLMMRAPVPVLVSSTTDDFFDIEGSWEAFREAKRIFTRLGHPERVDLVEAEGKHGVQPENLRAIVRWMRRWLLGKDDEVTIAEVQPHSDEELRCTPDGQTLRLPGEQSVFALNVVRGKELASRREEAWSKLSADERRAAIRKVVGVRPLKELPVAKLEKGAAVQRDGYHIDKAVLSIPGRTPLPMLTYHPKSPRQDVVLYLHADGKTADGGPDGPIEKYVDEGLVVVSIDLSGTGETLPGKPDPLFGDWKTTAYAYLLGQSLLGIRTEDVLITSAWATNYARDEKREVHLVATGWASLAALHAAALEPESFTTVDLRDVPVAWSEQLSDGLPTGATPWAVHNVLSVYDHLDLRSLIDPAKMVLSK